MVIVIIQAVEIDRFTIVIHIKVEPEFCDVGFNAENIVAEKPVVFHQLVIIKLHFNDKLRIVIENCLRQVKS
jgi:hypothetical protein